jgi:hypothetical protein
VEVVDVKILVVNERREVTREGALLASGAVGQNF